MKLQNRFPALLLTLVLCLFALSACSGKQETPAAGTSSATDSSLPEDSSGEASFTDRPDTDAPNETRTPPDIQTKDLTGFMLSFGDPEQTDPATGPDDLSNVLNSASFTLTLKTENPLDTASRVTCIVAAKPYDAVEDAEAQHVSFTAELADLQELQKLVERLNLIGTLCNYTDGVEAYRDYEFAKLTLLYASGEEAFHYCNTACDISSVVRHSVLSFFYQLLDKYNRSFYYHATGFADEESFVEAFLGQAPWDALRVPLADGTETNLVLSSDPTGRVFRLKAGDDVYAGSYKLKKKEEDGRWQLVLTLTQWPAAYTPMTKGGSVLIDTEVAAKETLVIAKLQGTASLFDPFFGEAGELSFTRNNTSYFDDKPFATDAANEETTE